jgi:hypothetical protein
LDELVKRFPSLKVTALLRNANQEFTERYPHISIVKGTFDDSEIIEKAAEDADIVIRKYLLSIPSLFLP